MLNNRPVTKGIGGPSKLDDLMTNLEEMTALQQQQVNLIFDQLNQFERNSKENFAMLSSLANKLLNQFNSIQIQTWDPGKFCFKITLLNLIKR